MKEKKIVHMIGNSHIDPVWLWQWQEGFQEIKASFASALDRMDEYDQFIFSCSSSAFYEWIEHNDSSLFERIKKRVKEGRWNLAGGWWVQSDCNIPCGESFVRQALYGQRYLLEKFGKIAHYGYNPDSFGHHAMLPQILSKSGCKSYVFMRPMPHEKTLEGRTFRWKSCDGSEVIAFRIPFEYCTWPKELHDSVLRCVDEIAQPFGEVMCFYGVGNHGGGPTKQNIESIIAMMKSDEKFSVQFSSVDDFFNSAQPYKETFPLYSGDLQHHASGCYAAHSNIKLLNSLAEQTLLDAEKLCTLAALLEHHQYPTDFDHAWKQVLFNQFHDILAGTSLKEAYDDASWAISEAVNIAKRNHNAALQSLSWNIAIDYEEDAVPVVVFNTHSFQANELVELEWGKLDEDMLLFDHDDNLVPYQRIVSHASARGRNRIVFLSSVGPLGYHLYRMKRSKAEIEERPNSLKVGDYFLENRYLSVHFDEKTGTIDHFYDKVNQISVCNGLGSQPVVLSDTSDTWSHGVFSFWNEHAVEAMQLKRIAVVERGPVRSSIEVVHHHGSSTLIQTFSLGSESKTLDVQVHVEWHEKQNVLKLRFPTTLDDGTITYEVPYGVIHRPASKDEEPGQRWVDITAKRQDTEQQYGLALVCQGKYSYDVDGSTIDLTVLRSPVYAHHDPYELEEERTYCYIDQGVQQFTYALIPHSGGWEHAQVVQKAMLQSHGLSAIQESFHTGTLPLAASYLIIDTDTVVMTAFKQAEDKDGYILRLFQSCEERGEATVQCSLLNCSFTAVFNPCEIKTFKIGLDGSVVETNLLEYTDEMMVSIEEGGFDETI